MIVRLFQINIMKQGARRGRAPLLCLYVWG